MIQIDHPWKVKDASNPNLKHSLRIENDELVGWALVGSGTQYKYQSISMDNFLISIKISFI